MKRKKWLTMPLLLTLVVLSQSLTPPSSALEFPAIYVDPDIKVDPNLDPTDSYTISIKTNSTATEIWGYELTLTYNPLILEGVSVDNVGLISNDTHPTRNVTGIFDNTIGRLSLTGAYFIYEITETGDIVKPVNTTGGPGLLANVTFNVKGKGDTPITLGVETVLYGWSDSGNGDVYKIIDARYQPLNIGHGYLRNTAYNVVHDAAVLSGNVTEVLNTTGFPDTSLYEGKSAYINVTVKNEGNVTERFDVSIYWRFISPNWLVYNTTVELPKETSEFISAVWDTENFYVGNGTVTVVVREVWNETDTTDNQLDLDRVHVRILGDTDANRKVDATDFGLLISVYPDPTPPPANLECDLDWDQTIDIDDVVALVGNLGKSE